jgi:hypothetical protein
MLLLLGLGALSYGHPMIGLMLAAAWLYGD